MSEHNYHSGDTVKYAVCIINHADDTASLASLFDTLDEATKHLEDTVEEDFRIVAEKYGCDCGRSIHDGKMHAEIFVSYDDGANDIVIREYYIGKFSC